MRQTLLLPAVTLILALAVPAQFQLSVQAVNDPGVALEVAGGNRTVQNFPTGSTFPTAQSIRVAQGAVAGPLPVTSTNLVHTVSPPSPPPIPILRALDQIRIDNSLTTQRGSTHQSLHTTGNPAGTPGAQLYDVTVTNPAATSVLIRLTAGVVLDSNTTASVKVTGGAVSQSWNWSNTSSFFQQTEHAEFAVPFGGSLTLRVEVNGATSPGGGLFYDGFSINVAVEAVDTTNTSFTLFGTGCGTATMRGSGAPQIGGGYTINLDNAPANAPVMMIIGRSNTSYLFLPLPIPLGFAGATGCQLSVAPEAHAMLTASAGGSAQYEVPFFLTFAGTETFFQWMVVDPTAPGGFTTTRGGKLTL